jgi:hypothetical protein
MWSTSKSALGKASDKGAQVKTCNKETQTMIRVYPYILGSSKIKARVICEGRCQTEVSIRPDQDDNIFYSMLEYIPFQDIQESSMRVVNLPRKLRLHFSPGLKMKMPSSMCLDDDGVNELCIELRERMRKGFNKTSKQFEDTATQKN